MNVNICREKTMRLLPALSVCALLCLGGCAAQTGIPGHGGGKRFAVEQELVAAATRTAVKQIDLTAIRGKKVNLYINAMGDSGAGNLTGGRFSIISQLHGDYVQQPKTQQTYIYPRYESTSTTTQKSNTHSTQKSINAEGESEGKVSSATNSTSTQTTTSNTLLNSPLSHTTRQAGVAGEAQFGMKYEGLGTYHNSEELTSDDLQYLTAIMETYMFLQGVPVVPPSEAEADVYITVDVYGTIYTRVDWFVANNEILRAKTGLEIFAVDTKSGAILMSPQSAVAEAEYNEQYVLWAGPVSIRKSVKKGEPLLADFSDAQPHQTKMLSAEKEVPVPVPFEYKRRKKTDGTNNGMQLSDGGPAEKQTLRKHNQLQSAIQEDNKLP